MDGQTFVPGRKTNVPDQQTLVPGHKSLLRVNIHWLWERKKTLFRMGKHLFRVVKNNVLSQQTLVLDHKTLFRVNELWFLV